MSDEPKVTLLRPGPSLDDIPGQLRQLAAAIEAGQHGEVHSVLVVLPVAGDYPEIFGWGDVTGERHPIVQFELAKGRFVSRIMTRR